MTADDKQKSQYTILWPEHMNVHPYYQQFSEGRIQALLEVHTNYNALSALDLSTPQYQPPFAVPVPVLTEHQFGNWRWELVWRYENFIIKDGEPSFIRYEWDSVGRTEIPSKLAIGLYDDGDIARIVDYLEQVVHYNQDPIEFIYAITKWKQVNYLYKSTNATLK